MATVPSGQKFHTVASTVETSNLGSKLANSNREIYTMGDIASSVGKFYVNASGGAVIGPNLNTIETSVSILIPSGTLTTPAIMDLLFRIEKNDASTTVFNCNIYLNTVNSLSGATLLSVVTSPTSKTYASNAQRFIKYESNGLYLVDVIPVPLDDFGIKTSGSLNPITFNPLVNNYILIGVGAVSLTSTSQVTFAKLDINA